jgi:hypothetical protein
MVELHHLNYASPLAVLFQRLTVIATDLVLFAGALRFPPQLSSNPRAPPHTRV